MRRWTSTEDELARELAASGYTRAEIADELGRTVASTKERLRRRNLGVMSLEPRGHRDAELRARALALVAVGARLRDIARSLQRTPQSVHGLLKRLAADGLVEHGGRGVWAVTKRWAGMDGAPEELREWIARGDSLREIARRLNVHHITVGDWVRDGKAEGEAS